MAKVQLRLPELMQVQVKLPDSLDPALAGSVQLALQKAADLLSHGAVGLFVDADRIAEAVVGVAAPDFELLATRIRRMEAVKRVFADGDWITAEEINRLQSSPPANKSLPASDWKRRGRIFSVTHKGKAYFARYQFDATCQPLPVIRRVLQAFGEVADPWILAAWFHYPNGWLSDSTNGPTRPVSPCQALHRSDEVVVAAERRHGNFVG